MKKKKRDSKQTLSRGEKLWIKSCELCSATEYNTEWGVCIRDTGIDRRTPNKLTRTQQQKKKRKELGRRIRSGEYRPN
jgi:hypothetical protein